MDLLDLLLIAVCIGFAISGGKDVLSFIGLVKQQKQAAAPESP